MKFLYLASCPHTGLMCRKYDPAARKYNVAQKPGTDVQILVDDSRTIEEVQKDFSDEYPFLKIEFISMVKKGAVASPNAEIIPKNKKLSAIRDKHVSGTVSIEPDCTVKDLLDTLENEYGLHARVYRKFGNMWIETGLTSHWSLSLQNTEGYEISEAFAKK